MLSSWKTRDPVPSHHSSPVPLRPVPGNPGLLSVPRADHAGGLREAESSSICLSTVSFQLPNCLLKHTERDTVVLLWKMMKVKVDLPWVSHLVSNLHSAEAGDRETVQAYLP